MLSGILAFLGALPGLGAAIEKITGHVFDAKVRIEQARTGASRDVAISALASQAQQFSAVSSSPILSWLVVVFAVPVAAFEWKVVIWDTMLGWGSTPAIHGDVATWMGTIIGWLFGSAATLALGQVISQWRK